MLYGSLCGIDIDHCINEQGTLTAEAADIIETMNSYTEYSISGTGIHILFTGSIPDKDRRNGSYEMYSNGRYLTVSSDIIGSNAVNERTSEAAAVHKKYIQRHETTGQPQPTRQARTGIISSNNLLYRMINSAAGTAIRALWDGDYSAYINPKTGETDHSAGDLALCLHLAYWTNGNAEQMDSMFRASGLMRDKWNEPRGNLTYGQLTINKALADFTPYIPQPKPEYKIIIGKRKEV
jgi:putative DNA primase/helicase